MFLGLVTLVLCLHHLPVFKNIFTPDYDHNVNNKHCTCMQVINHYVIQLTEGKDRGSSGVSDSDSLPAISCE